jgi:hypothetical protein
MHIKCLAFCVTSSSDECGKLRSWTESFFLESGRAHLVNAPLALHATNATALQGSPSSFLVPQSGQRGRFSEEICSNRAEPALWEGPWWPKKAQGKYYGGMWPTLCGWVVTRITLNFTAEKPFSILEPNRAHNSVTCGHGSGSSSRQRQRCSCDLPWRSL